ncbi:MAG: hypothetical protein HY460_02455 [Parcubacteria group bacterium]|nr:hypothetical protein [Parcubacteria group bacterium]
MSSAELLPAGGASSEFRKPFVDVLLGATIALAVLTWYAFEKKLSAPLDISLWISVIGVSLWAIAASILSIVTQSRIPAGIAAIGSFGSAALFYSHPAAMLLSALGGILFTLLSHARISFERDAYCTVDIPRLIRRGFSYFFTGLAIVIATAYVFSPPGRSISEDLTLSRKTFDRIRAPIQHLTDQFLPQYSFSRTIDDVIRDQLRQSGGSTLDELSRRGLFNEDEFVAERRREISRRLHVPLTGRETIADLTFDFVNDQLNALQKYGDAIGLAIGLGVFLTARAAGSLLLWVVAYADLLVFALLKRAGIVTLTTTQISKEIIVV